MDRKSSVGLDETSQVELKRIFRPRRGAGWGRSGTIEIVRGRGSGSGGQGDGNGGGTTQGRQHRRDRIHARGSNGI